MHGDIFIYNKVLFYLLSLINDISEFRSDQITFLSRPTYCRAASISHLQTFSVHGRMSFFAEIDDFPRPSSCNECPADFGPTKFDSGPTNGQISEWKNSKWMAKLKTFPDQSPKFQSANGQSNLKFDLTIIPIYQPLP